MVVSRGKLVWVALLLVAMISIAKTTFAQKPGGPPPSTPPPTSMPTPPTTDKTTQPADVVAQPSKQENKAIKTFRDAPANEADKKTQLGEAFIQQYPQSRYRPEVVSWLAPAYVRQGQIDKLKSEGDQELALTPNNPFSLALLGENLARAVNPNTPDMQKYLDQAEQYCKKSLEALASAQKPADVPEQKFTTAKNETAAIAHSGLGTVAFRRNKFTDAISELEQAVKLGGGSDPVNYYLLGKANEAATNFSDALAAYTKCAAISGGMQAACQSSMQEMKAHGAIAPK
jgi:tetratricopeptide (TPR) repeat protein